MQFSPGVVTWQSVATVTLFTLRRPFEFVNEESPEVTNGDVKGKRTALASVLAAVVTEIDRSFHCAFSYCGHEHGEKSTKYFPNLEKRNHVKKHICKLAISGVITTEPFEILDEQKRFYQNLYKSARGNEDQGGLNPNLSSFFGNLNLPQLSEAQKMSCEGNISVEECYKVLDTFQNNKTPGNDGIPIEFYRKFWPIISGSFLKCVNVTFVKKEMSRSQKQAIITIIETKGKDRSLLENCRPISLVNVDTKIISKVITTRIKKVLPHIIHHNQSGYVEDRYIGESVRSIFDIMEFTVNENIPGLSIFVDFQKAFDSLERDFLVSCLETFNFGRDFIHWVKVFYNNIQSCV